jgi:hypothetical protein
MPRTREDKGKAGGAGNIRKKIFRCVGYDSYRVFRVPHTSPQREGGVGKKVLDQAPLMDGDFRDGWGNRSERLMAGGGA